MATGYAFPRKPTPGGPLRTKWGDSVSRSVRQSAPIQVPGMLISRGVYGTRYMPETTFYRATTVTSGTLRPFDMRWYSYDGDNDPDKGEWQIYIPLGCLTLTQGYVTSLYELKNKMAKDADGNEIPAWYHIDEPKNSKSATVVETEDRTATSIPVFLNLKPWPYALVSGDDDAIDEFKECMKKVAVGSMNTIRYKGEEKDLPPVRYAARTITGENIAETRDISSIFSIRYELDKDPNSPKLWLVNQDLALGRLQKHLEDTDVTEWPDVWIKIIHDSENFSVEVDRELEGNDAVSDDNQTVFRIYTLKNNVIVADERDSMPYLDFYVNTVPTESGYAPNPIP